MILLSAGDTFRGVAGTASQVNVMLFGMERDNASGVEEYKVLYKGQLGVTTATLYTAPTGKTTFIKQIVLFCNVATTQFAFLINGTADGNRLTPNFSLGVNESAIYEDDGWTFYGDLGHLRRRIA